MLRLSHAGKFSQDRATIIHEKFELLFAQRFEQLVGGRFAEGDAAGGCLDGLPIDLPVVPAGGHVDEFSVNGKSPDFGGLLGRMFHLEIVAVNPVVGDCASAQHR